jgi:hypothetical protein
LPKDSEPLTEEIVDAMARDPLYEGIKVREEAWRFKRYYATQKILSTAMFRKWLAHSRIVPDRNAFSLPVVQASAPATSQTELIGEDWVKYVHQAVTSEHSVS